MTLTAGQRGDAPQAEGLLSGLLRRGHSTVVVADAAYDSDDIRGLVRAERCRCCIKPNPRRKRKKRYNRRIYRRRNLVERFFRRIKDCRRVATRHEKKAANDASFVWLAAGLAGAA